MRILSQTRAYGLSVSQAQAFLADIRQNPLVKHSFIADSNDSSHLPAWVRTSRQVTDGHLISLSRSHGMALATFDEGIPGAFVIPRI